MRTYDVIPFGERTFLLNFWPVVGFLQQFSPGQYYTTTCKFVLSDGHASLHDCVVLRVCRNNFANMPVDNVYILVKTDFSAEALHAAVYEVTHVGREISETQALAWKSEP
ncbi:hypothetical protein CYD53_117114 [Bosea psychrotolerans]|uniref:Uncharacterized protein n=1 Tax=Bosea psychrotolerans TaxID=1871628 RepID=A0A2S4LZS2_9HYPH|nr:hypothetical protein CYD53_117114 [Bosea psychrotolerans]